MKALTTASAVPSRRCHLQIPSELGFEKVAREMAWTVAQGMGLPANKCEDFRTAVSEATLNAIEHGNGLNPDTPVDLTFEVATDRVEVVIRDRGDETWQETACPPIADKVAGLARCRHMGLMLMQALVDEFKLEKPRSNAGTQVHLVMYV
jgi:serine/threonine-protein kinase RsbW